MLPAHLHIQAAKDCITYSHKKKIVTASYVSDAMQELEARVNNLIHERNRTLIR
jgi:hypothetical protein